MWYVNRREWVKGEYIYTPIDCTAFKQKANDLCAGWSALLQLNWRSSTSFTIVRKGAFDDYNDYLVMVAMTNKRKKWRNRYEIRIPYPPREKLQRRFPGA